MSTKKAVENKDPNEDGAFDPQLSKEANKKTAPEEKEKEVKEEAEKHIESNPMLATLTGRNEVKSGRSDHKASHVASHDVKKDKVSKPVEEPVVHENAEHLEPTHETEQEALKDKGLIQDTKLSEAKEVKDKPVKSEAKESPKPEVKGHTGHVKEVSKDKAPETKVKGTESHE
jgi:hypothetical protein